MIQNTIEKHHRYPSKAHPWARFQSQKGKTKAFSFAAYFFSQSKVQTNAKRFLPVTHSAPPPERAEVVSAATANVENAVAFKL